MATNQASTIESAGSSPDPKKALKEKVPEVAKEAPPPKETAPVGKIFHLKSETPAVPLPIDASAEPKASEIPAAGNQAYTVELKDQGHLGLFLKRSNTTPTPLLVELNPENLFYAMRDTIKGTLLRMLRMKNLLSDDDTVIRVNRISQDLATGCSLTAYLKIRALLLSNVLERMEGHSLRRPRTVRDLPIPSAYAFAIQQLGIVKVADLTTDLTMIPVFPTAGHTTGVPEGFSWNPNAYAQAVEYARNLGMRFSVVDLKVKNGSPWWLLAQDFSEDIFSLRCVLPETNYTDAMAVTHALFLIEDATDPRNPFVHLPALVADSDFGMLMYNPHPGINLSCFEAISDSGSEIWNNV